MKSSDASERPTYAVATGIIRIVAAIFRDENTILTISSAAQHYGISEVCLSLPNKVKSNGADHIMSLTPGSKPPASP